MGKNTNISWVEDTWNPFRAINKETGKMGHACVLHGQGCVNCYADSINQFRGTGLAFVQSNIEKVQLKLSMGEGQTSIDWPLRSMKHRSIFVCSMTDWMGSFYPLEWQSLLLATMSLATWHTFITLTKRWANLVSMLAQIDATPNRTIRVPADMSYRKALLRANTMQGKYNLSSRLKIVADPELAKEKPVKTPTQWELEADVPWLPRNVLFGISVCTATEADMAVPFLSNVRRAFPEIKLLISQEPALEVIDWKKYNLRKGVVDWIIWGGESGNKARTAYLDDWLYLKDWGETTETPIFFKQTGNVLAREYGLQSAKGDVLNEATLIDTFGPIQQYPNMIGSLI